MRKHPPNRRGISFEVGAQLEARDRLKNWYPAHIEEIDYEEGKVLIHFKRWNHRYDEWFCWDSPYLRPLEKIQLRKEGLHEEEISSGFHINDQVLACWSDCRFYPAKVTSVNKDGTYTVKFYDGVVQTVKNIHVKAFSKDQSVVNNPRPKERGNEIPSSPERWEKFKEQRKTAENKKKDKDEKVLKIERRSKPDKEGKLIVASEKGKVSEKALQKDGKEDKENISENDREFSIDTQIEKKPENDSVKTPPENLKETKRRRGRPPVVPPAEQGSQTLQPITLELRRRKIPKGGDVPSKRPRLQKNMSQEKMKHSPDSEKDSIKRRSRHSTCSNQEAIDTDSVIAQLDEVEVLKDPESSPKDTIEGPSETCLESDQKISEQLPPPSEAPQILVDDSRLKEETTKASSSIPESQESSEASVTVTSASKKTDDSAVSKAAVDHEPKFRCKFLDCSKSFRKAKLLHYHMKYFHGIEKSPEPQQSPATRNIQTRSLASEKASQESSNRRRTTSGCLCKYFANRLLLNICFFSLNSSGYYLATRSYETEFVTVFHFCIYLMMLGPVIGMCLLVLWVYCFQCVLYLPEFMWLQLYKLNMNMHSVGFRTLDPDLRGPGLNLYYAREVSWVTLDQSHPLSLAYLVVERIKWSTGEQCQLFWGPIGEKYGL